MVTVLGWFGLTARVVWPRGAGPGGIYLHPYRCGAAPQMGYLPLYRCGAAPQMTKKVGVRHGCDGLTAKMKIMDRLKDTH